MAPKTFATADEPPESTPHHDPLQDRARKLAERHHATTRVGPGSLAARISALEDLIEQASRLWSAASIEASDLAYAAEWLLDNAYVVRRALREIRHDMPDGYYRRLPVLVRAEVRGEPRGYAVAVEMLRGSRGRFSADEVERFLNAYQEVRALTMGELWALPTMLRLAVLEVLGLAVSRLSQLPLARPPLAESDREASSLRWAEQVSDVDLVSTSILSLRALDAVDWKAFFEAVCAVDRLLRSDPTYASMDFDTRDRYRQEVESLASSSRRTEIFVAQAALDLARRPPSNRGHPAQGHVGYYLIADGRNELEKKLRCRLPLGIRLRRLLLAHPTSVYLGGIGSISAVLWVLALAYCVSEGGGFLQVGAVAVLTAVPAVTAAVALVNWLLTLYLPPACSPSWTSEKGYRRTVGP